MSHEADKAGQQLRKQLWEPLLPHVKDAELVLVSTDGVLGQLPFAALPGSKANTYLIEEHRLAMIPVPGMLPDLLAGAGEKNCGENYFWLATSTMTRGSSRNRWKIHNRPNGCVK